MTKEIPFDYDRAKAGEEVMFRTGTKPYKIAFCMDGTIITCLVSDIGQSFALHSKDGKKLGIYSPSFDLVMAPRPMREGYVLLLRSTTLLTKEEIETAYAANKRDFFVAHVQEVE